MKRNYYTTVKSLDEMLTLKYYELEKRVLSKFFDPQKPHEPFAEHDIDYNGTSIIIKLEATSDPLVYNTHEFNTAYNVSEIKITPNQNGHLKIEITEICNWIHPDIPEDYEPASTEIRDISYCNIYALSYMIDLFEYLIYTVWSSLPF